MHSSLVCIHVCMFACYGDSRSKVSVFLNYSLPFIYLFSYLFIFEAGCHCVALADLELPEIHLAVPPNCSH